MNIQPDFVKEEQLQELSESFRLHNQIPPDLYTRYRIKRGLRNSDGTGVLVGATHLGNVHGYILNEGEREPIEGRLTYRGYNIYDLIHGLEREDRFGFEEIGYLLMCGELPTRRQLEEFQHVIGLERALPDNFTEDMIMRAPSRDARAVFLRQQPGRDDGREHHASGHQSDRQVPGHHLARLSGEAPLL